jgi:hypothetical protein
MKMLYIIHSQKCPICDSTNIRCSKRLGIAEQLACRITPVRPFRCNSCESQWRFSSNRRTPNPAPEPHASGSAFGVHRSRKNRLAFPSQGDTIVGVYIDKKEGGIRRLWLDHPVPS